MPGWHLFISSGTIKLGIVIAKMRAASTQRTELVLCVKTFWTPLPVIVQSLYSTRVHHTAAAAMAWFYRGRSSCAVTPTLSLARAAANPSEPPPPNTPVKPTTNIHFNEHPPLSLPTPFLPILFNSKSIELLTGSGEVLMCVIILKVGQQGSRASEKNFWPPPMLKFTYVSPFKSVGPLLHGPLYLYLSLPCGPFTPI